MTLIPVEYHGVHVVGPEHFTCVLLRWAEQNRIVPVWIGPLAAAELDARDNGFSPRRPGSSELLLDVINRSSGGVAAINIISHFEGVFIASIVLSDGEEIDARPSDAFLLARALEMEIQVEEDVLNQASFFMADDIAEEYFGLRFGDEVEAASASGDAQADADFEQMMRSLGMSEADFGGEDDTDVTKDDNGEKDV